MMNKRGWDLSYEAIIYLVVNVVVFSILFIGVGRAGTGVSVYEEAYAKEIALLIDSAKPGMTIEIDVTEILAIARDKNTQYDIKLNCDSNEVIVRAGNTGGYGMKYFNELKKCDYSVDLTRRVFIVKT